VLVTHLNPFSIRRSQRQRPRPPMARLSPQLPPRRVSLSAREGGDTLAVLRVTSPPASPPRRFFSLPISASTSTTPHSPTYSPRPASRLSLLASFAGCMAVRARATVLSMLVMRPSRRRRSRLSRVRSLAGGPSPLRSPSMPGPGKLRRRQLLRRVLLRLPSWPSNGSQVLQLPKLHDL
jgi:hypothetical protein